MHKTALFIAGLMWGDEDKGATTDWLARYLLSQNLKLTAVFRTNGGSQPAHTVITTDGRKHIFNQLTSASFVPGVLSHLSDYMLIDPINLLREIMEIRREGVSDISFRVTVDRRARIITPFHIAANRLREKNRGENRHGSVGKGLGEAQEDFRRFGDEVTLRIGELNDKILVRKKLNRLLELKKSDLSDIISALVNDPQVVDEIATFADPTLIDSYVEVYDALADHVQVVDGTWVKSLIAKSGIIAFEHTQGALLDPDYGFVPYVTHTKTTFVNADKLLDENGFDGRRIRLGLTRGYAHRHGEGPFPTFSESLTNLLPDPNNPPNPWQGKFRVGYFDPIMLSYALEMVGGVDFLALGHLDELVRISEWKTAESYKVPAQLADNVTQELNGLITKLIFKAHVDPVYQANLTRALKRAIPNYGIISKAQGSEGFLDYVTSRFNVPIGLISTGPTAADRTPSEDLRSVFS